ncbi:PaaI family thioesterase [Peptoniphilus catoniae]|uniref:PaaI family thioesterase n=1 Tax=Peptoniphilus catoniae TaxID=1660341 RepID=UPI0010FE9134|nr:PaaI family thioesterase [Peptoniphilus catoniae]
MDKYDKYIKARNEQNLYAIHLGIITTKMEEGYAKGEISLKKEYFNPMGSVHGGLIFSLADTIAGSASVSYGSKTATLSSNMNFVSAAFNTEKIVADAKVVKRGKKVIVVEVTVSDDKNKAVALGTFTFFNLEKPFLEE